MKHADYSVHDKLAAHKLMQKSESIERSEDEEATGRKYISYP